MSYDQQQLRLTADYFTANNNTFLYNQQRKDQGLHKNMVKFLFMLMTKQNLCFFSHHWLMNKHIYHWLINKQILHANSVSLVNNESLTEIIKKTSLDFTGYKRILQFNLPHASWPCQWICRMSAQCRIDMRFVNTTKSKIWIDTTDTYICFFLSFALNFYLQLRIDWYRNSTNHVNS